MFSEAAGEIIAEAIEEKQLGEIIAQGSAVGPGEYGIVFWFRGQKLRVDIALDEDGDDF